MSSRSSIFRSAFGASSSDSGGIVKAPIASWRARLGIGQRQRRIFRPSWAAWSRADGARRPDAALLPSPLRGPAAPRRVSSPRRRRAALLGFLSLLFEQRLPLARAAPLVQPARKLAEQTRAAGSAHRVADENILPRENCVDNITARNSSVRMTMIDPVRFRYSAIDAASHSPR